MKFQEIIERLTGFSTPIFGVQWNPPESQRAVARRVIAFMEDRRVLFVPSEMESPEHCVQSILRIREALTQELGGLDFRSAACAVAACHARRVPQVPGHRRSRRSTHHRVRCT